MSRRYLVLALVVAGYFGSSLLKGPGRAISPALGVVGPREVVAEAAAKGARPVVTDTKEAPSPKAEPAALPVADKSFEYEREFQTFSELHGKVLLTDEEQAVKKALLEHVSFLRGVGKRLLVDDSSLARERENSLAIDLLLEALSGSENEAVTDILRDVVIDASIEDAKLSLEGRQRLAGIKAEVLYRWSAKAPEMAGTLEGWLPGPVSRKIWENVARQQASNEAQSRLEGAVVTR